MDLEVVGQLKPKGLVTRRTRKDRRRNAIGLEELVQKLIFEKA
jgi:hypothetical protein